MAGAIVFELESEEPALAAAKMRPVRPVSLGTLAASALAFGPTCWLVGYAFREPAGAVAVWELLDGSDATGILMVPISLAASAMASQSFLGDGIPFRSGIFAARASGSIRGTLFVRY